MVKKDKQQALALARSYGAAADHARREYNRLASLPWETPEARAAALLPCLLDGVLYRYRRDLALEEAGLGPVPQWVKEKGQHTITLILAILRSLDDTGVVH